MLELQAGAYTLAGKVLRCPDWANQDAYLVVPAQQDRMFVAVLDGHGKHGRHVAGSVCGIFEQLAPGLLTLPRHQLSSALAQVFAIAQAALQRDELARYSGTTAVVAVVDVAQGCVTTAHVGNSRLMILGNSSEPSFKTMDHDVDGLEGARIFAHGGEVREVNQGGVPQRCVFKPGSQQPGLRISRSLGDLEAHTLGVLAEPTIHTDVPLRPGMALVAASDGLWCKLPRAAVASFANDCAPQDSARALVMEARARWPKNGDADDITAVVVKSIPGELDALAVAAAGA